MLPPPIVMGYGPSNPQSKEALPEVAFVRAKRKVSPTHSNVSKLRNLAVKEHIWTGMGAHAFNFSTQKVEGGGFL